MRFFYRQIIEGDTADNIGGVYKAGAKRAKEVIRPGMTPREMYGACVNEFLASLQKYGPEKCGYDNPVRACDENATLLWMLRKPGEVWTVPPVQRPSFIKPVPEVDRSAEVSAKELEEIL